MKSANLGLKITLDQVQRPHQGVTIPDRVDGVVKYIAEDFQVHEIDCDGNILQNDYSISLDYIRRVVRAEHERMSGIGLLLARPAASDSPNSKDTETTSASTIEYPKDVLTDGDVARIEELLDKLAVATRLGTDTLINAFSLLVLRESSKELRTKIHSFVRSQLPFLESLTLTMSQILEDAAKESYVKSDPSTDFNDLDPKRQIIMLYPLSICMKTICQVWLGPSGSSEASSDGSNTGVVANYANYRSNDLLLGDGRMDGHWQPVESLQQLADRLDRTKPSEVSKKASTGDVRKKYLHFNVSKFNRDTADVVDLICKATKRASFDIFTAGTKDKRAKTVQKMCMRRGTITALLEAMARPTWFGDVMLSHFEYKDTRLGLGDLMGNYFNIVIRGVDDIDGAIHRMERLRRFGFVNYFGLQRFGTNNVGTHLVGAALIKRDYAAAIRLILGDENEARKFPYFNLQQQQQQQRQQLQSKRTKRQGNHLPSDSDDKDTTNGIAHLLDKDPKTLLERYPPHLYIERRLLHARIKGESYEQCLRRIAKSTLSMYVHAAQSLIFNWCATRRLTSPEGGYQPVVGDLVNVSPPGQSHICVERITPENIHLYKTEDIVLPLPGDSIEYPTGWELEYAKVAKELLDVDLSNFATHVPGLEDSLVSISGSYRHLIAKPWDVSYRVVDVLHVPVVPSGTAIGFGAAASNSQHVHGDVDDTEATEATPESVHTIGEKLNASTDADEQEQEREQEQEQEGPDGNAVGDADTYTDALIVTCNDKNDPPPSRFERLYDKIIGKRGLIFTCSLPKCSYLTVALREVLTDEAIEACTFHYSPSTTKSQGTQSLNNM